MSWTQEFNGVPININDPFGRLIPYISFRLLRYFAISTISRKAPPIEKGSLYPNWDTFHAALRSSGIKDTGTILDYSAVKQLEEAACLDCSQVKEALVQAAAFMKTRGLTDEQKESGARFDAVLEKYLATRHFPRGYPRGLKR